MAFKKGQSGNPKGKPIGSKNRNTNQIRLVVQEIVNDNLENLKKDLISMPPKERAKLIIDLLAFTLPKLQAIATKDFTEEIPSDKIDLSKLSDKTLRDLIKSCKENQI